MNAPCIDLAFCVVSDFFDSMICTHCSDISVQLHFDDINLPFKSIKCWRSVQIGATEFHYEQHSRYSVYYVAFSFIWLLLFLLSTSVGQSIDQLSDILHFGAKIQHFGNRIE